MSGSNRLAGLKARPKDITIEEVRRVDEVGEARGFLDRTPRKKPGRKPSPRTWQLHPKVFPQVGEAIAAEAERLGITQGQLIERMWQTYEEASLLHDGGLGRVDKRDSAGRRPVIQAHLYVGDDLGAQPDLRR